jgi:hypothetical protein
MAVELFQKEYGYTLLRKWSETEQVKLVTFRAFTFLKQEKIVWSTLLTLEHQKIG